MANIAVFDMQGNEVGSMELADAIFSVEVNQHLVHRAVVTYLANQRQGTKKALTRSEVSGGGKKPWRQKGTGHARQGSIRAPQWKGGGVVFAPVPRDYSLSLNKKEKRAALKSALSNAVLEKKLIVVDEIRFDEIKTKKFQAMLNALKADNALVVLDAYSRNALLSSRNIPDVKTTLVEGCRKEEDEKDRTNDLNTYDLMKYHTVIISKQAIKNIEEVYA